MSRPLNIAHRGGAGLWPENTMAAFAGAAAMGAHGFELDVHITRDGEVAVYHDDALKPEITRGPDGTWITRRDMLLKDMTFAELQAFDVGRAAPGSRYAAEHPVTAWADGARVPHLREVLALVRGTHLQVWIELKSNFVEPGRTVAPYVFAEKVVTLIRAERAEANVVIIGFDWRALVAAQRLAPDLPVWFTTLPQSWFGPDDPPLAHWPPP
ncbi:MAG TPA: glycerophosphodiester phosphodiesterase, partial [Alphaproteobacteria bacterium]|nr:glycerophosphodiester phosphodiesterase [Alphaproteobacteria bacterium]